MKRRFLIVFTILLLIFSTNAYGSDIVLDGDFSDWADKPFYDPKDHDPEEISGFRSIYWFLDNNDNNLYFYIVLDKPKNNGKMQSQFVTDLGKFDGDTFYDISNNTVDVVLKSKKPKKSWEDSSGRCAILNNGSVGMEFYIPISFLVEDMQSGYLINFRFIGGAGDAPRNSWLTISTISTYPYIGIAVCIILSIILPLIIKKRKSDKCAY